MTSAILFNIVVLLGFEPKQTGPESVVLPLHHKTIHCISQLFCKIIHNCFSNNEIQKYFGVLLIK